MTTRTFAVGLLGALLSVGPTMAQTPVGQPPADDTQSGAVLDPYLRSIDFGVRISDVTGDEARFERYRDMRTGVVLDGFRWTKQDDTRYWRVEADNVGYRDQRYSGAFEQFGRFKAWFEYNQVPYYQSNSTRTPFTQASDTQLTIDDALQSGIQSGTTTLPNSIESFANGFTLRTKRDITTFGATYQANRQTDINFSLVSIGRSGNQPWGAGFGMGTILEVPAPIQQRDTQIAANVEWSNKIALVRAGYDGSIFNSDAESLTWDNPLRITDIATASSQGRMSRWPSSTVHTLSATLSVALPARSRVTAYVGQSAMASDIDLLPWSINSAQTQPPRDRTTLDADVDVTAVMLRFNSRPARWMWVNANFRSYDFNNKTAPFYYDQKISYDSSVVNTPGEMSHPLSFNRGLLELDASFTPFRNGAFRVGYVREDVDRTHRIFETTVDDTLRVGYDWTSNRYVTVRADFSTSQRRGDGFDEEILDEVGEQPGMRHYDIADRDRDMGRVIVTAMPTQSLSVNFTASGGQDDYPDTSYGLKSQDFSSWGFGADFAPSDALGLGFSYTDESYSSLQSSRTANPAPNPDFFDPRRDWSDDIDESVGTWGAYVEVPKIAGKLDLALNYDYTKAETSWYYSLVANSTLATPTQLQPISNSWAQFRLEGKYWMKRNLAVGLAYLYDRFDVDDWAFSPQTLDRLAYTNTFLLMNYSWRPYTANTVWLKATYLW